MGRKHTEILRLAAVVVCLAVVGIGVFFAVRWAPVLGNPENLKRLHAMIASLGVRGWFVLLAIQYVQIVIAFIPGGPVQILAGILYGPAGGLATCVLGIILASATVFSLTKRFGGRVVSLFIKEQDLAKYRFIQDEARLERLCFLLYLIPGAPKDVLTYVFALTPMPLSRFLLLSVTARIPAALTSALAGDSLSEGKWVRALVYFLVITAISLAGLVLQRKIMSFYHRKRGK